MREAADVHGLLVVSEVMEISQIESMLPFVDLLQVGARNMQNFNLLRELGQVRKPVLLKRGMAATIEELLLSSEYILSGGNYDVILCERGIRTYETATRNTMDISAIPMVKKLSHLPMVGDPSHGTGRRDMVAPMARAAVAAGADGLLDRGSSQRRQGRIRRRADVISGQFDQLMKELRAHCHRRGPHDVVLQTNHRSPVPILATSSWREGGRPRMQTVPMSWPQPRLRIIAPKSSAQPLEAFLYPLRNRAWRIPQALPNLQHGRRRRLQPRQRLTHCGPVDGAIARPQVLVFRSVIVVYVHRHDPVAEHRDRLADTHGNVRMPQVEADADAVQVSKIEDRDQVLRRGRLAQQVFHQHAHAQRPCKCAQVLEGRLRELHGALRPAIVTLAQVYNHMPEWNVFGRLQRALDLVHGIDAPRLLGVNHVDCRSPGPPHLVIGPQRRMQRKRLQRIGTEPVAKLAHMFAAGVVEVLPRGEDLHRLHAGSSCKFQESRMQPLIEKEVGREHSQHGQKSSPAPARKVGTVRLPYFRIPATRI